MRLFGQALVTGKDERSRVIAAKKRPLWCARLLEAASPLAAPYRTLRHALCEVTYWRKAGEFLMRCHCARLQNVTDDVISPLQCEDLINRR